MMNTIENQPMTGAAFALALRELGWKQSDFCRKMGLDKNTPSRWVNGITPVPAWVPQHLALLLEIKRLHTAYLAPPKASDATAPLFEADE
jgi:transcriptional regulator with XRE-family HTH domain